MEKEDAVEMFLRSLDKHNLRYTTYVGDGDSSSFGAVKEALQKKYGDKYPLEKEDCIGHIQKRMGTSLRSYKNKARGTKLKDGFGVGGAGRLTDGAVDQIQTNYGYAIRNNKGEIDNIICAIWALFYHTIRGSPSDSRAEQHFYCPKDIGTWCKYYQDVINKTELYDISKCIPYLFREQLKPIFERLASRELLLKCQRGLTQNQNESLNGLVWSRCPKRLFCGIHRFTISVCDSISQFNNGAKGRSRFFKCLNIDIGDNSLKGLKQEQKTRLRKAATKVTVKYKKRRQILRSIERNCKKDKSYIASAFADKSVPDIDFTNEPISKKKKLVPITFIDDNDVLVIKCA